MTVLVINWIITSMKKAMQNPERAREIAARTLEGARLCAQGNIYGLSLDDGVPTHIGCISQLDFESAKRRASELLGSQGENPDSPQVLRERIRVLVRAAEALAKEHTSQLPALELAAPSIAALLNADSSEGSS